MNYGVRALIQPRPSDKCSACIEYLEKKKPCECQCHEQDVINSKHHFISDLPMKKPAFWIRWINKLRGEKFESI